MKRLSINLLVNIVLLLTGLLLLVFYAHPDVLQWLSRIMGLLFVLPALAYLLVAAFRRRPADSLATLGVWPALGGLCFGVVMILKSALFVSIIAMLMGGLLLALGLFHLVYMMLSHRAIGVKLWYYLLPLLVLGGGASILWWKTVSESASMVTLISGVALLLFNVSSLQEYLAARRSHRESSPEPEVTPTQEPKENIEDSEV